MAKLDAEREAEQDQMRQASNKVALTKKAAITTEGNAATALVRPFDIVEDAAAQAAARDGTNNYRLTVKRTGSAVEVEVEEWTRGL